MRLAGLGDRLDNPHAMNPRNCAARFAAALTVAGFAWAILLSVAPQWHERIHADANRVEHSCAVTFIAAGQCEHSAHAPTATELHPPVSFDRVIVLSCSWVPSLFLSASLLEHAPPTHSLNG